MGDSLFHSRENGDPEREQGLLRLVQRQQKTVDMQQVETEEVGSSPGQAQCFWKRPVTSVSPGFLIYITGPVKIST